MGGATFLIGLLPTYGTVGVLAPVLLIVLRLVQGFALGGEWGGAVLIVSEHGKPEHRGFWASWPQAGAPAGNLLATGVLALLATFQTDEAFEAWGWRIPFLLSAVLILVGLWVRLTVSESPVFLEAQRAAEARAAETGQAEKAPIVTVLTHYKREVLTAMGARIAENVSFYLLTAFSLTYLTNVVGVDSSFALNAVLIASAVHLVTIPLWGHLSDRIGRRPVYLLGEDLVVSRAPHDSCHGGPVASAPQVVRDGTCAGAGTAAPSGVRPGGTAGPRPAGAPRRSPCSRPSRPPRRPRRSFPHPSRRSPPHPPSRWSTCAAATGTSRRSGASPSTSAPARSSRCSA
jgi:MFS family permease